MPRITQITLPKRKEVTKVLKDIKKNFYAYANTFLLDKRKARMELEFMGVQTWRILIHLYKKCEKYENNVHKNTKL